MIYLFSQDNEQCILFNSRLFIEDNMCQKEENNKFSIFGVCQSYLSDSNVAVKLATYNTLEDCKLVMEHLKKKIRLHEEEFTFPKQEFVDGSLKR